MVSVFKSGSIYILFCFLLCFLKGASAQERFFYTNKPYGSEALFNPLTLFVNGGYDITQLQSVSNIINDHRYGPMFRNVIGNLADPFPRIRKYGTAKFFEELVPFTFSKETAPWIPNYGLHLVGCGMLYTAMKEWYQDKNFPVPWLFASTTLMAQHLMNETMETGPYEGWSVDEISDIYIFDLGGIILFSFDNVNRFFHDKLNLSDWSLQASITFPKGRINAGQFFSIKWKFPFSDDYSLFYRFGEGAIWGASKKINLEDNLSFGVGFRTKHLIDLSNVLRQRTIETSWQTGVFYDRNNSLLASIVFSGVKEYFCSVDIYPGIIKYDNFTPGIWSIIGSNGNFTLGLSTKYLIGTGYSNF